MFTPETSSVTTLEELCITEAHIATNDMDINSNSDEVPEEYSGTCRTEQQHFWLTMTENAVLHRLEAAYADDEKSLSKCL